MSLQIAFLVTMLVWVLVTMFVGWPRGEAQFSFAAFGPSLFNLALLVMLGWRVFGAPIKD